MPETSRLARIASGQPVFGPTLDALLRELALRLGGAAGFRAMVEEWPLEPGGAPRDADVLLARLLALRQGPGPATQPAGRPPGSPAKALAGLVLGAAAALPIGFVAGFILLELLLPSRLAPTLGVAWAVTAFVTLAGAALGAWQGGHPTRLGHAVQRGVGGFLGGALLGALLGLLIAGGLGAALDVPQREGAFAMGVVFAVMPFGGLLGGIGLAAWMARRAWRGWDRSAPAPP
jgi:hypothetical protein